MSIRLFEHNQTAYEAAVAMLKDTGTDFFDKVLSPVPLLKEGVRGR